MTSQNLTPIDGSMWKNTLLKWAQTFPYQMQGMPLIVLLREKTPVAEQPLLEFIAPQHRQSDDLHRWQTFEHAKAFCFSMPIGALAFAQFWFADGMSPEGLPQVYPEHHPSLQMLPWMLVMLVAELVETPAEEVHQLMVHSSMLEVS